MKKWWKDYCKRMFYRQMYGGRMRWWQQVASRAYQKRRDKELALWNSLHIVDQKFGTSTGRDKSSQEAFYRHAIKALNFPARYGISGATTGRVSGKVCHITDVERPLKRFTPIVHSASAVNFIRQADYAKMEERVLAAGDMLVGPDSQTARVAHRIHDEIIFVDLSDKPLTPEDMAALMKWHTEHTLGGKK